MSKYFETRYKFDQNRSSVWKAICEYLQKYVNENGTTVDLGCGYCDFINNIDSKIKIAVDINSEGASFCNPNVRFIKAKAFDLAKIKSLSVDTIFASNLLEHLNDAELQLLMIEFKRILKKGGKIILMQPNYKYAYRDYFDDYTHKKVFSHISIVDFFVSHNFTLSKLCPKFMPFSLKSRLPKSYFLTKIYLQFFFKPFAKQMLVIFINR
ncbi:class I SAM-dependent methyltransferase [Candidatus Methylopumilus universalis]|jgi:ubiquinone/menaquinone biosynthesis C-methylase UbiE|uniref:class I SAM-dependent methyltransferase n=1 Tax=Candidatus Methylopumilus universalis TaxID=2588536 RepID=UPI0011232ACE|nr:class I SAM-dependent methyltransferase [Candidatus Methylopumilus universalis]QDC89410.1 class I SAM-dependent methyltransferase [Candidatus Methylopumilus universalis]QDC90711.1 class I SAM-dependent methyltransferase [Candidatus Methylopumilus universalis]